MRTVFFRILAKESRHLQIFDYADAMASIAAREWLAMHRPAGMKSYSSMSSEVFETFQCRGYHPLKYESDNYTALSNGDGCATDLGYSGNFSEGVEATGHASRLMWGRYRSSAFRVLPSSPEPASQD